MRYIFLLILASGINAFSSILLIGYKMFCKNTTLIHRDKPRNYTYIVPCYNESVEELSNTLKSITKQQIILGDTRTMMM